MKKIVIPTDFSNCAMKAVAYAAEIAEKTGSFLYVLHVVPPLAENMIQPLEADQKYTEELNAARYQQLDEIKASTLKVHKHLTIETELARGSVVSAVLDLVKARGIDLIVMGTTGASGLKQFFMGSVAAGVIENSKIPVLTVPAAYDMDEPDNIIFATSHFEENDDILNRVKEWTDLFSAQLHIAVFAGKDDAEDFIRKTRDLERYTDFLKRKFPDIKLKAEMLEGDDFEKEMEKYEVRNEADIIVMVTYPKSIFEKMLSRSVTQKLAFHSTIPILAIPSSVPAY